jgi:hypothetical protein
VNPNEKPGAVEPYGSSNLLQELGAMAHTKEIIFYF